MQTRLFQSPLFAFVSKRVSHSLRQSMGRCMAMALLALMGMASASMGAKPGVSLQKGQEAFQAPRVWARIKGTVITDQDVHRRAHILSVLSGRPLPHSPHEMGRNAPYMQEVAATLIEEALQEAFLSRAQMLASDQEVSQALVTMEKANKKGAGFFKDLLEKQGIPFRLFRDHIRVSMSWQKYLDAKFRPGIVVKPQNIEQLRKEWIQRYHVAVYRIAEIVVPENKEASQTVKWIQTALNEGAHFAQMSMQFSQAPTKGAAFWMRLADMVPVLRAQVAALREDDLPKILGPAHIPDPARPGHFLGWIFYAVLDGRTANQQRVASPIPPQAFFHRTAVQQAMAVHHQQEMRMLKRAVAHRILIPLESASPATHSATPESPE